MGKNPFMGGCWDKPWLVGLPLQYVKNSFRVLEDGAVEFGLKNLEGSARISVSPSIFIDGEDVTSRSQIRVGGGEFRPVEQNMVLDVFLGQTITVRSRPMRPLGAGAHTVKVVVKINMPLWATLETEFRVET